MAPAERLRWALLALVLVAGCHRPPAPRRGHVSRCACTFLTDFDDAARIDIEACIDDGRDVPAEAALCAGQSAHNHVDSCACAPPAEACDPAAPGACRNK